MWYSKSFGSQTQTEIQENSDLQTPRGRQPPFHMRLLHRLTEKPSPSLSEGFHWLLPFPMPSPPLILKSSLTLLVQSSGKCVQVNNLESCLICNRHSVGFNTLRRKHSQQPCPRVMTPEEARNRVWREQLSEGGPTSGNDTHSQDLV